MPTPRPTQSPLRRWLALALGVVGCVGTPTPEPPDLLPRPQIVLVSTATSPREVDEALAPIDFNAPPGSVEGGSDVWIVNLDRATSEPITVRANANGSFSVTVTGASTGDRIRIVERNKERHSLPLDLEVVPGPVEPLFVNQVPDMLACLTSEPEDITVVVGTSSVRRRFVLANNCGEAVSIGRAALRFGDQGFVLSSPPARVPAAAQVELEVTFEGRRGDGVRTDIVLLELTTTTARSRRGLGVWSLSASDL